MSVHVMSWVLRNSDATLGKRLILLVLADHAQEDGDGAWPSIATIAHEARLSERQVQYALRSLEDDGAITRTGTKRREGQRGRATPIYRVIMTKHADIAPLENGKHAISDTENTKPIAPEPSLEPSLEREPNGSLSRQARNDIWDTLSNYFGEPTTRSAQTLRGKVVSSLAAARASPEEIVQRVRVWPRHFDNATLTETALEKHWDTLGRTPMRLEERRHEGRRQNV